VNRASQLSVVERRRRRRKPFLTVVVTLALAVLTAAGWGLGAAVGAAAAWARSSERIQNLIPAAAPSLPAAKVAPPQPVNVSGPAVACSASALTVSVQADRTQLEVGGTVGFHVTVTHTGGAPCLVNGGMENLRLRLVDSTGLVVYNTADCPLEGAKSLLMGPGAGFNTFNWDFGWDGRRSAPGACGEGQPAVPNGAWQLIASLGEVAHSDSEPVALQIGPVVVPQAVPDPVTVPDVVPAPSVVGDEAPALTPEVGPEPEPSAPVVPEVTDPVGATESAITG